jgi:hypothetical protein
VSTQIGDPTRVRLADAGDVDELLSMCKLLHGENGIFDINEFKVRDMLCAATHGEVQDRRGVVGVIGEPGSIEASIYLQIGPLWYTDELSLVEQWNYVLPMYRRTSASKDLIAFSVYISDIFHLPLLIGVLSSERTEAKIRFYRRQLGDPVGVYFAHNVTPIRGAV